MLGFFYLGMGMSMPVPMHKKRKKAMAFWLVVHYPKRHCFFCCVSLPFYSVSFFNVNHKKKKGNIHV